MDTEDQLPPTSDFEQIKVFIPGFKGYKEKDRRESSDRMLREFITAKLKTLRDHLDEIVKKVASEKRLDLLSDYDDLLRGIKNLLEVSAEAEQNYDDFFAIDEISDTVLSEIYTLEAGMLAKLALFFEKVETLHPDPFHLNESRNLEKKLEEIEQAFSERDEIMEECRIEEPS